MARLALIAHDETKPNMIDLAREREKSLAEHELIATGTTGKRLQEATSLSIDRMASGPVGGDLMIGAEVARGSLDGVIFLRDPQTAQPHEPDITALLRICDVTDTALATNRSTAEFLLDGVVE